MSAPPVAEKGYPGTTVAADKIKASFGKVGPAVEGKGRLAGKVAIVTGAASGLGLTISQTFAREGATVVCSDITADKVKEVATQINNGVFYVLDVSKSNAVTEMFVDLVALLGRIDIVVNNAGIVPAPAEVHECTDETWHKVTSIMLDGAFYMMRSACKAMIEQEPQGGVILNMSSTAGLVGMSGIPAYTATKAALIGLTREVAVTYARRGIRCVAIAPTTTRTPMVDGFLTMLREQATPESNAQANMIGNNTNPMEGIVEPQDVANAALFLCSEEARWISGSCLPVDGCYTSGSHKPHCRGAMV